jgi:hypothetical protein
VNRSAAETADVPPGEITLMSTVPTPGVLAAVIIVSFTTVTLVAGLIPKSTAVAPVNPAPVIATNVPPPGGPTAGVTPETVGVAA